MDILTGSEASRLYENQEASLNKQSERMSLLAAWQTAWDQADNGRWTHRLIPDISMWTTWSNGEAQCLTGNGGYREYLYRLGLNESPDCPTCEGAAFFFICARFKSSRRNLETELDTRLMVENLVIKYSMRRGSCNGESEPPAAKSSRRPAEA